MGILRTDKISGLETPTAAVTGSVYFDGSDDSLTLPDSCGFDSSTSYTVEMWVKDVEVPSGSSPFFTFGASGATNQTFNVDYTSAGNLRLDYYSNSIDFPVELNDGNWHHIAATYDGTTRRLFADGYLGASDTTTSGAYVANNVRVGRMNWISRFAKCYISNLRVVTGTALYTSDFTVPTHALEVIDGTILLCCNNKDNAAAIDHGNIGVSKSITVNGGAAVSTLSPGLTRDFTFGTEFKDVTTFDTQGYFVPPSGTTTERFPNFGAVDAASARGVFGGGRTPSYNDTIDYITISTTGNAQDFGNLTQARGYSASSSSRTRGVFNAGATPGAVNTQDFITISSTGDALDFGEVQTARYGAGNASSSTRGVFGGGNNPSNTNVIEFITIATTGSTQDFGDLTQARVYVGGCSSSTRGVFGGGSPEPGINTIDFITISSTGNATNFGDLTQGGGGVTGCSSRTRGLFAGRISGSDPYTYHNIIDYITIAALGNAIDFGDLTAGAYYAAGCSSSILGVFGGLTAGGGAYTNTIDYVTIASTGDAADFGDLSAVRGVAAAVSNGHGGLG